MKKTTDRAAYDLLQKTELKIDHIQLDNANLTDIAHCVADVIELDHSDVLVVDCRDDALTLDILDNCVNARSIVGREGQLRERLNLLPGVKTLQATSFSSNGMLGWISLDEQPAQEALALAEQMTAEIMTNISRRVVVFSSGREVAEKQIEDTNTPTIKHRLEAEGYRVSEGETLSDDKDYITAKLREMADYGGYGCIITTGGVGAEDKDHTVEAITALDPQAATPYICHFKVGIGRHIKDGIRIAVGDYNGTLIIALPGPNDEVRASVDILAEGLKQNCEKAVLAERLAANLRAVLREKMSHHHGH
ncbi:MAG: molybdopterin-binding protein [Kiritimatiellia bacterium]|jgi:molybdenum cofactor synthesis domain-containing protein|nr:molybdopterin-binding protein [Pseudomonadales bacterium]MDP7024054.1 molybdopterin-binding protein [Kiritimatiellia bacterium]|tara:strand:- start:190 stop:1110 length:921 start_codon:yes stop_codon:yes gene_type:complete